MGLGWARPAVQCTTQLPCHTCTRRLLPQVPAAIISGLSRGATYTVQVRALSRLGLAASEPAQLTGVATSVPSPAASSAAAGASGSAAEDAWACVAAQGYPVCAAGSAGLCTPITCAEMVGAATAARSALSCPPASRGL